MPLATMSFPVCLLRLRRPRPPPIPLPYPHHGTQTLNLRKKEQATAIRGDSLRHYGDFLYPIN